MVGGRARAWVVGLAIGLVVACGGLRADEPATAAATLTVAGGTLGGRLLDTDATRPAERPTIRWQSAAFAAPFEFPVDAVGRIEFPPAADAPSGDEAAPWRVDLVGGDSIAGSLVAIDEDGVKVAVGGEALPTVIALDRAAVKRVVRPRFDTSFDWDKSLDGWTLSSPNDWETTPLGISNRHPWTTLFRRFGGAGGFRIDLGVAWSEKPRLRIGLGGGAPAPAEAADPAAGAVAVTDPAPDPRPAPYGIEFDAETLVAVHDEGDDKGRGRADLRICGPTPERGIELSVFIDPVRGRMVVAEPGGRGTLADFTLPPGPQEFERTLLVEVGGGSVELRTVRVSPWSGDAIGGDVAGSGTLFLRDGSAIAASDVSFAEGGDDLAIRAGSGGTGRTVPLDAVRQIRFTEADAPRAAAAGDMRLIDRFGSRVVATLLRVEGGKAWVGHPAIAGEVGIPLGTLVAIESVGSPAAPPPLPGREGRYVGDAADIAGCLVPITLSEAATVGWLPEGSLAASPLAATENGHVLPATIRYAAPRSDPSAEGQIGMVGVRIDYSDGTVTFVEAMEGGPIEEARLAFPVKLLAVAPRADGRFVEVAGLAQDMVMCLLRGAEGTPVELRIEESNDEGPRTIRVPRKRLPEQVDFMSLEQILSSQDQLLRSQAPEASGGETSVLVLVTGESIGCRVESLDERGLLVRRHDGVAVTIPAELLKAVELVPSARVSLSPEKFRSLVTLPRAQRGQPPTHLVRSPAGDYLRGRVLSLDADALRIAIDSDPRGKPTTIPRRDVARLVWLHPEALEDDWVAPRPTAPVGIEVEAVGPAMQRTRIAADSVEGSVLSGRHAVIGATRIDLDFVDRLLLGGMADTGPLTLPYSKWQLQPAAEPRNLPPRGKPAGKD